MREPFGDLGLPVGGPAVDTGAPRVVHRHAGVDRFVAHPAPPAVALGHVIKKTHPSKLARPAAASDTAPHGPDRRERVRSFRESAKNGDRRSALPAEISFLNLATDPGLEDRYEWSDGFLSFRYSESGIFLAFCESRNETPKLVYAADDFRNLLRCLTKVRR
ncbi:hypothetical protein GCM10027598_61070 [Amycolatopsis oliviviridis]|uniref:Uncharacterized protein n=1 Tax=Amycolatopsis oliviviridis TaxID=1471590 RepID=A0ABQ3M5W2_9PSEU|nr:hypothetical protein GCM10017790_69370 [Amycolatopsis oliviviridis]